LCNEFFVFRNKLTIARQPHATATINVDADAINTALLHAADEGNAAIVIEMIERQANVNTKSNRAQSRALIRACKNGHHECVLPLLAVDGIDVNVVNEDKGTALMLACWHSHVACVRLLLQCNVHLARDENKILFYYHIALEFYIVIAKLWKQYIAVVDQIRRIKIISNFVFNKFFNVFSHASVV